MVLGAAVGDLVHVHERSCVFLVDVELRGMCWELSRAILLLVTL